ncbi:MAG: hypothetical protein Q8M40_04150 [Legionella sp.]|nr:hypothetical protein [Legionella sp.]
MKISNLDNCTNPNKSFIFQGWVILTQHFKLITHHRGSVLGQNDPTYGKVRTYSKTRDSHFCSNCPEFLIQDSCYLALKI